MKKIDGRYLKKLREEHGYSLREFADLVYSSKSSVQRWEKSFAPENRELLSKIAEIYGTTVEEMRQESDALYSKKTIPTEYIAQLKHGTIWLAISIFVLFVYCIIIVFLLQ